MKKTLLIVSLLTCVCALSAQEKGYLTGSLDNTSHIYVNDPGNIPIAKTGSNGFNVDDINQGDRFATNSYLKLDYYKGNFSAGLQMEGYYPRLAGYPDELNKFALSNIYVNWADEDFRFTVGTFYDQFGSGLLFRSWEDRTLGINNAIMGARFAYNWDGKVAMKAFWGMPRLGMEFSATQLRGADLSISLSDIIGLDGILLSLEGSVLNRFEEPGIYDDESKKASSMGYSGRFGFDWNGFVLKGEYVDLGEKQVSSMQKRGNAQLVELGYNGRGLGVTLTGRRLEWMSQRIKTSQLTLSDGGLMSTSNVMSYVPAMSTQYTYMLTTLHPYVPQVGDESSVAFNSGEIGGQLDAFYNFRRGTALGGKRGMKVHANFSTYYTIAREGTAKPGNLLFRDLSIDVEKQWTKQFKMVLLYSMQEYNPNYGSNKTTWLSNIVVADLLYKWTSMFSTRLELQYLKTYEDHKDWMAALLEVSFAPHWCVWGSDMYNHGDSKAHFYNVGVSYTKGRTRLAAGYGRYKDGMICSGGSCREIPRYTGANFTITTSF